MIRDCNAKAKILFSSDTPLPSSDIMFAAVVVPLFGVFYSPGKPSPRAAFVSVLSGVIVRVVLEFSIPKDKIFLLPFEDPEFLNYGPAASARVPVFVDDKPGNVWDPTEEPCVQESFEDFIGVDSLSAFLAGLISFVAVTMIERATGKALFSFGGLEGYEKDLGHHESEKDVTEMTKKVEEVEGGAEVAEDKESKESGEVAVEEAEA